MNELNKRAIESFFQHVLMVALPVFLPACTLYYWQGWVLLAIYSLAILFITIYLLRNDTRLLERRIQVGAEKDKSQRLIQPFMFLAFGAAMILPSIAHRLGWSNVPLLVVLTGDALVAMGLLLIFFVFKENTYASAIIEIAAEQKIIDTGPYALVRHPMYTGGLIMLTGVPLALGSWWGLLAFVPSAAVLVWRTVEEGKVLIKSLAGYTDYQKRVKYRLVPFVW